MDRHNLFPLRVRERHDESQHDEFRAARTRGHRWVRQFGLRVLIDYADVQAVLTDHRFRTSGVDYLPKRGVTSGPLFEWRKIILSTQPPDIHRMLRALVSHSFTAEVLARLRVSVAEHTINDCTELGRADTADLVTTIFHRVPIKSLCDALGFSPSDLDRLDIVSTELGAMFGGVVPFTPDEIRRLDDAIVELTQLARKAIADRRSRPGPDVTTRLIAAADSFGLGEDRLAAIISNLVIGGHGITRALLSCTTYTLLGQPDRWRQLAADPGLAARTVEEANRLHCPAATLPYVAMRDLDVNGLRIERDELVLLSVLAANRDPAQFREPDRFDPDRSETRHLGMGGGPHYCIGAPVARVIAQETMATVASRFPDAELPDPTVPWTPISQLRAPAALRVCLGRVPAASTPR